MYSSSNLPAVGTGPGTSGAANQNANFGVLVAGHDSAVATAEQINKTETYRDPDSFALTETLKVTDDKGPVRKLNELEWIKGEIWANQWQTDRIARISPDTGVVIAWIDFSGLFDWPSLRDADAVLNGIAYDRERDRVFVTGKTWPFLFEVRVETQGISDQVHIDFSRLPAGDLSLSFHSFRGTRYSLEHWRSIDTTTELYSRESIIGTGHRVDRTLELPQAGDGFFRVVGE